jgi:hypothetical protein
LLVHQDGTGPQGPAVETVLWRCTDKVALAFSEQDRDPVIRDGETVVLDRWSIAAQLEDS